MDFSKFDARSDHEAGARMTILHPITGEPIADGKGKTSAVIVRGIASPTVQADIRRRHKEKLSAEQEANLKALEQTLEDVHEDSIATALPMVIGFENVERDGRALKGTSEDIRWFLNLTFPIMETDAKGKWQMVNRPFAVQIAEFSGKQANFTKGEGTN